MQGLVALKGKRDLIGALVAEHVARNVHKDQELVVDKKLL